MSVVVGLEDTLRLKGIEFTARQPREEQQSLLSPPAMTSVVAVLKSIKTPMGAREIHRALHHRGIVINYSTLYKMLIRASKQRAPVIRRRHGKYELSESATNDTGTDR